MFLFSIYSQNEPVSFLIQRYNPEIRVDIHWRGHQTPPTVVSLKGRLPQIMQARYTLSCDIIQIHSLFRRAFIKKPKSQFNRNRK